MLSGQAGSYHGVEWTDLDGDGIEDLVTTSEAGKVADDQGDDTVALQYLKGNGDGTFTAPITLASGYGGSLPVAYDVDDDGRLDIVTSQYFGLNYFDQSGASFMWFEQTGALTGGALGPGNFTRHVIATADEAGFGFQIRPVPDFREPGEVSWIATNHQGRCFVQRIITPIFPTITIAREMVMEFVPGADLTQPWDLTELSIPDPAPADPDACDPAFNVANSPVPIHPGGNITARSAGGQAGPGVFGYGDFDGDGDIDLLVSGDGDRRLFWIEQEADGGTLLHTLTAPGRSSARPEARPCPTSPATSKLKVTPRRGNVAAGAKGTWKIRLTAGSGAKRSVTVTFKGGQGKAKRIRTVKLTAKGGGTYRGTLRWAPPRKGKLRFAYAGTPEVDTAASTRVTVRLKA